MALNSQPEGKFTMGKKRKDRESDLLNSAFWAKPGHGKIRPRGFIDVLDSIEDTVRKSFELDAVGNVSDPDYPDYWPGIGKTKAILEFAKRHGIEVDTITSTTNDEIKEVTMASENGCGEQADPYELNRLFHQMRDKYTEIGQLTSRIEKLNQECYALESQIRVVAKRG